MAGLSALLTRTILPLFNTSAARRARRHARSITRLACSARFSRRGDFWARSHTAPSPFAAQRQDVGRSISRDDESKLMSVIPDCRSPAMLPVFVLAIDSGLRASEVRALRRRDLALEWREGVIVERSAAGGEVQNRSGDRSRGSAHAPSSARCHAVALAIPRGGTGQLRLPP